MKSNSTKDITVLNYLQLLMNPPDATCIQYVNISKHMDQFKFKCNLSIIDININSIIQAHKRK